MKASILILILIMIIPIKSLASPKCERLKKTWCWPFAKTGQICGCGIEEPSSVPKVASDFSLVWSTRKHSSKMLVENEGLPDQNYLVQKASQGIIRLISVPREWDKPPYPTVLSRTVICSEEIGCKLSPPKCANSDLKEVSTNTLVKQKVKDQISKKRVFRDVNSINDLFLLALIGDKEAYELFISPSFSTYLDDGGDRGDGWVQTYRTLLLNAQKTGCLANSLPTKR